MNTVSNMEPWIIRAKRDAEVTMRIICIPFPGGSASAFLRWPELLPEHIEVCAVQLPGRQKRIAEAPFTDLHDCVNELSTFLGPLIREMPFAIYGDCASAFIAFELCRYLDKEYDITPSALFVTCCRAPQLPLTRQYIYHLPDQEFKQALVGLGFVPHWLQQNDRAFSGFLPLIRADFEMVETYQSNESGNFNFPIVAISAKHDTSCTLEEMRQWQAHTNSSFRLEIIDGGHNLSESHTEKIASMITNTLDAEN
jgi:medium-chain acyl-[acyl-carrier-protein] hydrolase